ncbi:PREDICTED: antigen KI-67 isoform X3 [Bison bison bison]|uniref:Antigen KI-67 isoform X3 n=1 Tax=Bison bison bison TaxID=43346 RepID=A0A6P3IYN1_BISBB|nr:PREDICTED: antigen KI-67 isoform X3 [Bison bison bison]
MGPTRRLVTIKRSGVDGPHFPLSLSTCLFGRSIECDIRIQLPVVSKQHCKIEISEQEAVLFNFSSTNPTQINGSTFDKPVQLKHGDVITIVDRSFRYENESHQDGSKSPGFPGQRRDQEASRRVSRSSLSSNPEGKAQDSSAHSEVTEEAVSGRPVAHGEDVTATHAVSGRQEDHVSRKTPSRVRSSELPGDTCRGPTDPTTGDLKEDRSVASGTCREEPKALSSIQCLKRSDQSESPFRKLYESMKVELDVNPGKDNLLQNRRKSGLQHHCTAGRESADGLQDETLVSPKSRRKSGRSPHMKADPGLGEQGSSQTEGDGSGEPVQMPKEPKSPGIALTETETRKTRTPVRCSQQTTMPLWCSPHSPSRRQRSEDPSVGGGRVSQSLDQSEGSRADDQMFTPQKFLPGNQTPVKIGSFENTPEKLFSRKRKSVPANVDRLTAETEIPPPMISAPLALQVERKIESDLLNKPEKLGPATGQVGPGLSGLDTADVSSFSDSTNKMEGMAAKRRRVSFGGCLRPELFDENLPPNTPLKRGETPKQRRSLAAHTPTVLKKIIKPQPSGKKDSSEVRLKVTSPDAFMSPLAANAIHASAATPDRCRRLSKVSCVSGVSRSPHQTDVPRKGGRRSGSLPPQRASLERNQHGILQTIFSRRRSGASEANLIVARSWADVVKLGAKQAQNKAVKRGLPKQPGRRQRRANTPKKPPGPVHSQFSTGHANSPCTIVIGKAQLEKVTAPARPYRVINNFLVSKPRDFSEDLSGLPEMFKTPVKEKPQRMSMCPPTFPNSEDLLGKELPGPHSGEKPLLCTLENFGEDVFPRTHDTAKGPSDQSSASPALRRPSIKMSQDPVKTPRSTNKTIAAEIKTPVSTTATPKATSSANRSRRSAELSGVQTPGTGPENQDAKPDTVEDILGRRLRKTPQPELKLERDTKESEKSLEQCKQNIKSKENSEKTIAVRRSRRASELKCEPAADLTTLQRSQDTEPEEKQVDILSLLQTPVHAKEVTDAKNKATRMSCKSPKPGAVSIHTRMSTQLKTPSQKVDVGSFSDLRKLSETPGKATPTQRESRDAKSIQLFKETSKQKLDPAENSAGSKRRPTTPKGKAPPLEDLAGFKELFQTPHQAKEPMTDDKTTKTPCTSPQSESVNTPSRRGRLRTPSQKVNVQEDLSALRKPQQTPGKATRSPREPEGGDKGIAVSQEAPEEMLDLAEKVPSAKRRPRTPKGKAQPLEDLTGFKELFQTPDQAREPMTDAKTTKTPCTSPQPEPVNTPSRTPSQKVNVLEGLSALRKPQQTPGKTTQSPREPEGGDKGIAVSQEAPEEMLDLTEKVPSAKRRPRTPKRKAQPLEDLTGFKELFQTPDQAREPMTDAKTTKTLYKSPAETVNTPTSKKRRLKSPPREVGTEEELSVLRRPAQTPRGTRHSGEAGSDFEDIKAFTGTLRQKLDPGIKRQLRTPKEKVQSLEDLTGFRELFQTPDHTKEPRAVLKTPKMLCQSPLLEPVNITPGGRGSLRTPSQKVDMQEDRSALWKPTHTPGVTTHSPKEPEGGDRGAAVSREAPEEKPDPAEHSTASKRRPRTPQEKAQLLEDLDGFKELFQTPDRANGAMTDDKLTTMPCTSPPAEPFNTPTSEKRRLKSSPQKVGVKEELSALRRPAQTPRGTRHSEGEQAGDGEEKAFKKTPKQKLDSAESLTGSKRRPRASLKEKAQPLEDLTGFKELFQTPRQSKEPMTDNSIPQMLCQSPQPEPVTITPGRRGHLRTPSKTVDRQEDCSALRKPQQTPGETTHSPREPEDGDRGTAVSQEAPEEKPDSAENVTAHKRWPRITKEKAQPLEDLSGFKELFQTPDHAKQPIMIDDHPPAIPCKSPAEPVTRRTGRKKQLRSSPEKVGVEEPSALRRPSQTPEEATRMQREAEEDEKDIKVCKKTSRQKLVSAENVTGIKSRLRNIKEKAQPTEDPARVKEPFQNPNQTEEPASDVKIAPASCQSPPVQPVIRRTTRQRRLRSPPGKVAMEEPSASTGPTQTPGDTHTEPVGKGKDSKVLKETSGQKLSPAENVTGIRSRLRTLKKKTQPLEDSASVKELFQKPDQAKEADGDVTIAPGPRPSPPAEPVTRPISRKRRPKSSPEKVDKEEPTPTPGESTRGQPARDEEDSRVLKENPRQKLNPAENVPGVRSRLRTLREKTQPLEDPASVKELFQDPDQVKEPEGDVTTIPMPRQSPPAKPITRPTSRKRRLKASPEKVDIERPSALREPTWTPGETTHSEPVHDEKDNRVLKENSKQKLNPAENVTGVRSRLRTLREKTQPLEDPASVKELFQDPDQVKEPEGDVTTIPMPRQSPPAKPITRPTSRKRRLKASPEKVDIERPSALREPTRTPGETTHSEPVHDEKDNRVLKENSKQKLNPAENVIGVRSRLRTLKEKTQPLKDLAGAKELFQKQDGAKEPVSDVTMAPAPHQSPPAQPVTRRTGRQKQLRSPPRKVAIDKPSAVSRPAQTPGEMTHTEPVGDENKIKMAKETSRRNLNSAENFIGVRSRQKAFQEKTVEDPAGSQEPFQKPDQAEELESSSTAIKRASKQTADRRPVETSRRVLRAPKVRFTEDLVGSREPAKHPGESCVSPSPEREQGEDGRVTGRKRLRPVTAAQDPEDERPLQKKQRTAPRETREPPEPPGVKKRSLWTLAQRTEPGGNLPNDDLKAKATDPQEVAQAPNKGVSLRSRRPAKTSVEEQRPEVLISEEKVKIKRSEKKSVQPSQEMKLQSPEDGAKKPASGGKVEERRTRSRPGRQNQPPLPEAAEEKAREGRVDIPAKKQEEKEGTGHSDPKGSRSRKVSVRPRGNPSETASEQRATRSAKRCAHSLQKESDNVCVKKMRTRSRRDPEDI